MDKRNVTGHLRIVPEEDRELAEELWHAMGDYIEASRKQMKDVKEGKITLAEAKIPPRYAIDEAIRKLAQRSKEK